MLCVVVASFLAVACGWLVRAVVRCCFVVVCDQRRDSAVRDEEGKTGEKHCKVPNVIILHVGELGRERGQTRWP